VTPVGVWVHCEVSLLIIALDVAVIWALATYRREVAGLGPLGGRGASSRLRALLRLGAGPHCYSWPQARAMGIGLIPDRWHPSSSVGARGRQSVRVQAQRGQHGEMGR
jgi:hypothetical protein